MKEMEGIADAVSRDRAVALHRAGRTAEAMSHYEAILAAYPADAEIWGMLAVARFGAGQEMAALTAWGNGLALAAPAAVRLRLIANLLLAAQEKPSAAASELLASLVIPDWPEPGVPGESDRPMLIALARGLVSLGRKEEATRLLTGMFPRLDGDTAFVKAAIPVLINAGSADKATLLLQPMTSASGLLDVGLLIAHAAAAHNAGQDKKAWRLSRRAAEAMPVYLTAKEPGQSLLVAVLNRAPAVITQVISPAYLHFSKNTPANIAFNLNDKYRFLSIFAETEAAQQALAGMPRPDIILNNWVNAEILSTAQTLDFLAGFADRLGRPVINHPRRAAETTRQKNAERLAGIAGLIVPSVVRFVHDQQNCARSVDAISRKFNFPVIIRVPFTQKGAHTVKIDTPDELARHLAGIDDPQLYAIQYIHNPAVEGVYRKIRAAVIGADIFITHVQFAPQWNVHRNQGELSSFDHDGRHKAFTDRIIARPEETLGPSAWAALHEIRRRTPLDLYGIDFDIMPDGRILFFEANAAMTLSMVDRAGRESARAGMREALRRLFENPPPVSERLHQLRPAGLN